MNTAVDQETLKKKMLDMRRGLQKSRSRVENSWQHSRERTVELEERAQQETDAEALEAMEEQQLAVIRAIDAALARLETGHFGRCRDCGHAIDLRRLETVPWTELCRECVNSRPRQTGAPFSPEAPSAQDAELPPQLSGLDDAMLEEAIWDALVRDGRVETRELQVSAADGHIILEGALPGAEDHEMLMQIIQDRLGIRDFTDNLRLDPLAWERLDRTPGVEQPDNPTTADIYEGTRETERMYDAQTQGEATLPPDHLRREPNK